MGKSKNREGIERCKCCLEDSDLKKLWSSNDGEGDCQTYGEMLTDCFALTWKQPSNINSEHICENCVKRLQDAINFKKEILFSEQRLLEKIKDEPLSNFKQETEFDDEITTAYLTVEYEEENADDEETNIKAEPATKPETISKKKNNSYTDEDVQKSVDAVIKNKISQSKAAVMFNVPRSAISRALARRRGRRLEKPKPALKRYKQYKDEDLKKCLEEISNNTHSKRQASILYNISYHTICRELAKLKDDTVNEVPNNKVQTEIDKHGDNIATILLNTNATPIKAYNDFGYNCSFCPAAYENACDLKQHTINSHTDKEKREYIKGKKLIYYIVRLDITGLQCNICNRKISSLEEVMQHLKDHGEKMHFDINNHIVPYKFEGPELSCTTCQVVFASFKALMQHMNRHSKNYVCDTCGLGFVSQATFQSHRETHKKGAFPCNHCSKVFETRAGRHSHESGVHTRIYVLKCGICGETFNTSRKKKVHVATVHGVKLPTIKCQVCDTVFRSRNALRIHTKRDHLMERRHVCQVCDMKFFNPALLKNHMLKHSGVKKYQCDVCKKSFARMYTLSQHMRIHMNDRRYKCEHCGLSFIQKCSWRGHMRSKHGEEV